MANKPLEQFAPSPYNRGIRKVARPRATTNLATGRRPAPKRQVGFPVP